MFDTLFLPAQGNNSTQLTPDLLQPWHVPKCPKPHKSLDFIMDLPPSENNTMIHFILLLKLLSGKESANVMIFITSSIYMHYSQMWFQTGDPKVWSTFCKLLGASVSLSSGFHTQSNGQSELANQSIEAVLCCLASRNPTSWSY